MIIRLYSPKMEPKLMSFSHQFTSLRIFYTIFQYCHRLHVVHRDLKPENVVFFERLGIVKLTDFGFSNQFDPGQRLQTSCGSLAYSAPEILLGDAYDAPAVGEKMKLKNSLLQSENGGLRGRK